MTSSTSFERLSQPFRDYLTSRAGNYEYATARDLYADIPSDLYGNEPAMWSFLRGNETLGVEPREWMHLESEANGGLDVPENLDLGPRSINRSIGADNVTDADMTQVQASNADAVDVILDADPEVLLEAVPAAVADATEATVAVTSMAAHSSETLTLAETVAPAEAGLGELIGEALADGVLPAIVAGKAAMHVADKCDTTQDKLGWGAATAGTTVLLYSNPVTGPVMWAGTAVYSGYKLFQLGRKLAPRVKRQVELHQARQNGTWA